MNVVDDIWLGKNVTRTFPQVTNIKVYDDNFSQDDGGSVASIYIRLDKSFDIYDRKVNDVLTLLAAIGGLQKALFAFGMFCVSLVAQKVFMSNIIKRIY